MSPWDLLVAFATTFVLVLFLATLGLIFGALPTPQERAAQVRQQMRDHALRRLGRDEDEA